MGWSKNHLLGSSMSLEFMVKTYNRCISQRLHRISSQNADLHDVYEQRKSWRMYSYVALGCIYMTLKGVS